MIPGLCQDLFDYCCAKCLGAEIDFKAQEAALDKLGDFIREHQAKLDRALKIDADRRKEAQEQVLKAEMVELAEAAEDKKQSKASERTKARWYGGCLIVIGAIALFAAVSALLDPASRDTEGLAIGFTVGVVGLIAGIWLLIANKKPSQITPNVEEEAVPAGQEQAPQKRVCAYCGRENPLDAAQCRECGQTDFKVVEQQPPRVIAPESRATPPAPASTLLPAKGQPTSSQSEAEQKESQLAGAKKAGINKGCAGCLGLIVLLVVIGAVVSLLTPSDPNYEAGKAEGHKYRQIESDYGAVTKTPQHHTDQQALQVARTVCPQDLSGEAREKWIQGFTENY